MMQQPTPPDVAEMALWSEKVRQSAESFTRQRPSTSEAVEALFHKANINEMLATWGRGELARSPTPRPLKKRAWRVSGQAGGVGNGSAVLDKDAR